MTFQPFPATATAEDRTHLSGLYAVLVSMLLVTPGIAQSPCDVLLPQAEASYEEARFDNVPTLVKGCLKAKPSKRQRTEAYALLAKAYVMGDRVHSARLAIEDLLRADSEFEADARRDPSRFIRLVAEVRRETTTVTVASVSKTAESLREAPATVIVVTAEEIERRGYLDLEAVIDDLPGFDISRTNGLFYSNIYQRGLRSDLTTRTLLLIDGIEENELQSQVANISRQYPLSNIEKIEVIYGPASTMYGANAFAGVINVITKDPEDFIDDGRTFGAQVVANSGSFDTNYIDATVAGRTPNGILSWSLTGRGFQTSEPDLSELDDWNYDPADFDRIDYSQVLGISGVDANGDYLAQQYIDRTSLGLSPYYTIQFDGDTATSIELTAEGVERARELDQSAYLGELQGRPIEYSDKADERYISGKLKVSNFVAGFKLWELQEGPGAGWTDLYAPGTDNGSLWAWESSSFFAKYSRSIREDLSLSVSGQYRTTTLGGNTNLTTYNSYARKDLDLKELAAETSPFWFTTYLFYTNRQGRTELNLSYRPTEKLDLVAGIELRNSLLQRTFIISLEPNPEETGFLPESFFGDNQIRVEDQGFYVQASYWPLADLKMVAGGRVDYNQVRQTQGYGTVFNPRLALIYTPGSYVFKAVYSEAFQDASNAQKYQVVPGAIDLPSLDLQTERIENLEISASWEIRGKFNVEVAGYSARVSDLVVFRLAPCPAAICGNRTTTLRYSNAGALEAQGAQVVAAWQHNGQKVSGNLTYSRSIDPVTGSATGDIARYQVKAQYDTTFWDVFGLNIQGIYVGARDTVPTNPVAEVDAYVVFNAGLTYRTRLQGVSVQVVGKNMLDEEYYHPGFRAADGVVFAARLPQACRAVYGRVLWSF